MKTHGVATALSVPMLVLASPMMTRENSPRAIKAVPARR
jgi:hypothetical protein